MRGRERGTHTRARARATLLLVSSFVARLETDIFKPVDGEVDGLDKLEIRNALSLLVVCIQLQVLEHTFLAQARSCHTARHSVCRSVSVSASDSPSLLSFHPSLPLLPSFPPSLFHFVLVRHLEKQAWSSNDDGSNNVWDVK